MSVPIMWSGMCHAITEMTIDDYDQVGAQFWRRIGGRERVDLKVMAIDLPVADR